MLTVTERMTASGRSTKTLRGLCRLDERRDLLPLPILWYTALGLMVRGRRYGHNRTFKSPLQTTRPVNPP